MENRINPVSAFKTGWTMTKEYFIVSLGLVLGYAVISGLMGLLPSTGVMGVIVQVLSLLLTCVWTLGITRITINAVDGEEPQFSTFGEVMPRLGSMILLLVIMCLVIVIPVVIIVVIATLMGLDLSVLEHITSNDPTLILDAMSSMGILFLLIIIPCVYLSIRLYFAPYLLVDRGMSAIEAVRTSWTATAPIQGKVLVFLLLSVAVSILGFICLFVGIFVAMIVTLYAQAALYRQAFPAGLQDPMIVEDSNVVVN